jgi:hypothetical protein
MWQVSPAPLPTIRCVAFGKTLAYAFEVENPVYFHPVSACGFSTSNPKITEGVTVLVSSRKEPSARAWRRFSHYGHLTRKQQSEGYADTKLSTANAYSLNNQQTTKLRPVLRHHLLELEQGFLGGRNAQLFFNHEDKVLRLTP